MARKSIIGVVIVVVTGVVGVVAFKEFVGGARDSADESARETRAVEEYLRAVRGIREAFENGSGVREIEGMAAGARKMEGKEFRQIREASNPRRERQRAVLGKLTEAVARYAAAAEAMKGGAGEKVRGDREAGDAALREAEGLAGK